MNGKMRPSGILALVVVTVGLLAGLLAPQTTSAEIRDAKVINDAAGALAEECAHEKGKSSWDGTIIFCLGGNDGDWACDVQTGLCACKGSDGTWENCVQGHPLPPNFDHVAPGDIAGVDPNPDGGSDSPPVANPSVTPPTDDDQDQDTSKAKSKKDKKCKKDKKDKKCKKGGKGRKK